MVDMMEITGSDAKNSKINRLDQYKNLPKKRKRISPCLSITPEDKQVKIDNLRKEINCLVNLYKDSILETRGTFVDNVHKLGDSSLQSVISCLMEESDLPLSKLVDAITENVKGKIGNFENLSNGVVRSTVIMIGQRVSYGVSCVDADVLEDEVECSLWCWETRDLKLLPKVVRSSVKVRRACRKKIRERISAVLALISSLENLDDHPNSMQAVLKDMKKLDKVNESNIRLLVNDMLQRSGREMAEKETDKEEKFSVSQMEKRNREMEKERKKIDRQLQKEKLQNEKEQKRLNDEAEKERRRREKEEYELQKQLKRQQEESERDQRRKEKEKTELKKQLALQKQASLMERFLRRNKTSSKHNSFMGEASSSELSLDMVERKSDSVAFAMDSVLEKNYEVDTESVWKLHLNSWRRAGVSIRSNKKARWGIRQKPKAETVKELKLTSNKELTCDEEMTAEEHVDAYDDSNADKHMSQTNLGVPPPINAKQSRSKQLLQFDNCFRPAFYGVWPKKSQVAGPRHPFAKDPDVDYEIDSDEEWEEDEPGESLSDCDKDASDEAMEEGHLKEDDEDGSEDGFFVPDGYLSEDERVQETDEMDSDEFVEKVRDLPDSEKLRQSEEFCSLLQQQKYLTSLTQRALKKNQPLIITNLCREKETLLQSEDLVGTEKVERTCLQALCIRPYLDWSEADMLVSSYDKEDDLEATSIKKSGEPPLAYADTISDCDLPRVISVINSSGDSIRKIVEMLHQTFPTVSKSRLRTKVREISQFSDNRWQVKREVLSRLGLSPSPEKNGLKAKSIDSFFSKRSLPPSQKTTT